MPVSRFYGLVLLLHVLFVHDALWRHMVPEGRSLLPTSHCHTAGIAPLIATAAEAWLHQPALAAAVVFLMFSGLSFAAVLPLARVAPHLTVWAPLSNCKTSARNDAFPFCQGHG
jgi:hypothetical protein